ncbi:MAG: RpiB/LacA/LacB family sugar-phosphate isomerase [Candidatus Shapirobacteria bacterium]|nr:RpiB/LacA/LacB family sugar-phosphate isomerase [Candidatus Shapirobacteria bacterium]
MLIYLAADHRGFFLKEKLKLWLESKNYQVRDFGNLVFNDQDDYPDFSRGLAEELNQNPNNKGIVICGSGIGVDIVVNRFPGVRCGLGFNKKQVSHGRLFDNINCLALAADFTNFIQAKKLVWFFLKTSFTDQKKYKRRLEKINKM